MARDNLPSDDKIRLAQQLEDIHGQLAGIREEFAGQVRRLIRELEKNDLALVGLKMDVEELLKQGKVERAEITGVILEVRDKNTGMKLSV